MKKSFKYLFLLLVFLSLAGCGPRNVHLVNVAGSTSVQPLAELLAETYMKEYPGVMVNVQGGGSSAGIEAVSGGVVEIGMSSRPLKDEENILIPYQIAFDAVAVVVNPHNPVNGVSLEMLRKIYAGDVSQWAKVFAGGAKKDIDLVTREDGSGTRDAFDKMVMKESVISPAAIVQDATGVVREIVANDPAAIGYISLGIVDRRVKILSVDGVRPSMESVKKQQYKITRPFLFVFKSEPTGESRKFLDFVLSPAGQKIVRSAGFLPAERK